MAERNIRKIAIIGGGTAGWMTAAALSQLLKNDYCQILLAESEEIGTVGVGEATIPQIANFNKALGIDEDDFLRFTGGTFKLGIEFVNWSRPGDRYIHPFGPIGHDMEGVAFPAYWLNCRARHPETDLDDYSLQSVAARMGRFMRPVEAAKSPVATIRYAFHFDAGRYAAYLRAYAEQRKVERWEGRVADVRLDPETGFIRSVAMADGREIEADLFIDCSGFRGLLIEQALKAGYEDWSRWLPCDRALAVQSTLIEAPRPYTRSIAGAAGWQWRIPLQHRMGNGIVYCSAFMSDAEAEEALLSTLEGERDTDPRPLRFVSGKRRKSWVRNCVSIGLASGFMEPLESTSIHLIQRGIARLLGSFPNRDFLPPEIERFNRATDEEWARIRDFLILHYWANERREEFWRMCRDIELPDSLREKIDIFRGYGRVYRENDELFGETSWSSVLIGQRVMPKYHDPVADIFDAAEIDRRVEDVRDVIARCARTMPTHADFIRQNCAAPNS